MIDLGAGPDIICISENWINIEHKHCKNEYKTEGYEVFISSLCRKKRRMDNNVYEEQSKELHLIRN